MNQLLALSLLTALLALIFGLSFGLEPRRLINGMLFNLFALSFLTTLAIAILSSGNRLLIAVCTTLFVLMLLFVGLIFALHIIWLLWNAWLVWRRESHSIGNMLTLVLALGLVVLEVLLIFSQGWLPTWLYRGAVVFVGGSLLYEMVAFYNFLTILVLYNLRPVRHNKRFLIVLGAGLIGGEKVSPLLAARIDVALRFYNKEKKRSPEIEPKILLSGGQGADEKLPEAVAMQRYAIEHGVPESDTLVETESKTTYQNMLFSRRLIEQQSGEDHSCAFFTNNYHLFRAGVFARAAKLPANGVGSNTAFYFLPNAVIREYGAFVVIHKLRHLLAFGAFALLGIAVAILSHF